MENMPQMCNYIWPKKSCCWMPTLCSYILFFSRSCPLGIPSKQSPASPGDKQAVALLVSFLTCCLHCRKTTKLF